LPADRNPGGYAFVVLLDDAADSLALAELLRRTHSAAGTVPAVFLVPPVRGLAFFADATRQSELDAWWSVDVPGTAHPVYLVTDAPGLEDWLSGVDGTFFIGVSDAARVGVYADEDKARPFVCTSPLDFAVVVMHDHSGPRNGDLPLFDQTDALRMAALSGHLPLRPDTDTVAATAQALFTDLRVAESEAITGGPPTVVDPPPPAPLTGWPVSRPAAAGSASVPTGVRVPTALAAATWPEGTVSQPHRPASRRLTSEILPGALRARRRFRPQPDTALAQQLAGRGATIVAIGSRKGGVGKTSFAAGIAIAAGSVLDQVGHMACIVDANIANPDAWGQMNLPAGAATVRDTVTALLANRETPPPVHAATPALACYPEVRESMEYSRTAIRRLADHLRRRYTLIVVDMSNRLPDPTAGPEAAVAAYWLEEADVLVLPTTSARADFNGALDYLELGGLPPTVVAYIVPGSRRLRENPVTQEYVRAVRRKALSLVEVPDEANAVRLAGMEGVPVEQLSSGLRLAYRELTEVIAVMPRRPRE
jgi:MinD-like ATPase involved in chromosome partitioning or flagellar assembly